MLVMKANSFTQLPGTKTLPHKHTTATKIFSKKMRFVSMRVPEALEDKVQALIFDFLEGDDF